MLLARRAKILSTSPGQVLEEKNLQEIDIPNYLDVINFWISPWAPGNAAWHL